MPERKLFVNVDHVATLRQARRGNVPDPVSAASIAEMAGADGIIVHLREDRRHIQDRDLTLLRETVKTELHLEMAAVDEMIRVAQAIKPEYCVLVPEKREELTTEGGLDIARNAKSVESVVKRLKGDGLKVSLFIDPDLKQIETARKVGADMVELHTGEYCNAELGGARHKELLRLQVGAEAAAANKLGVAAGHGLDYANIAPVLDIPEFTEFNIGFCLVARAVLVGLDRAVRDMVDLIRRSG